VRLVLVYIGNFKILSLIITCLDWSNCQWCLSMNEQYLGPVYTTVEKSTGHEKKGVSQLWLVENATLDRWVFTLGEENNGGELFSWMIKWHGRLRGGTFWSWASPASRGRTLRTRNSSSGEAQLNRNILLPLILLLHIHHLPHITMSWPSIFDRPEANRPLDLRHLIWGIRA
jgi:hypothetical protein